MIWRKTWLRNFPNRLSVPLKRTVKQSEDKIDNIDKPLIHGKVKAVAILFAIPLAIFLTPDTTDSNAHKQKRIIFFHDGITIPNSTIKSEQEYPDWFRIDFDDIDGDTVIEIINDWKNYVEMYALEYGIDKYLIYAMIYAESMGNPRAVSHMGAEGLLQLMPATARSVGVLNAFDPRENIRGGLEYISLLMEYNVIENEIHLLCAWNAGASWVYKGKFPKETREFICKVLSVKKYLEVNAI